VPQPLKVVPPLHVARIERGEPGAYAKAGLNREAYDTRTA
jgi:hypothetical protein